MKYHLTNESLPELPEPAVPATISHVHIEPGVTLDLAIADARQSPSDPTVLFFLPWSEYVARPDATDRYRLLATALSSRVIALSNLGMGPGAAHLPNGMRRDIEHGDFGSHERMHIEALHRLSVPLGHVSLMGYSLGASLAARFARELEGYGQVDSFTVGEPVGVVRQHTIPLMRKFAHEIMFWARDRSEMRKIHPDWMAPPTMYGATLRHFTANLRDYMAYPRGLATAPLVPDLRFAHDRTMAADIPIRLVNGGGSVISTTSDNERLALQLEETGYRNITHDVYVDEVHGAIDVPRKIIAMLTAAYPET